MINESGGKRLASEACFDEWKDPSVRGRKSTVPTGLDYSPDSHPALPCRAFTCRRFAAGVAAETRAMAGELTGSAVETPSRLDGWSDWQLRLVRGW